MEFEFFSQTLHHHIHWILYHLSGNHLLWSDLYVMVDLPFLSSTDSNSGFESTALASACENFSPTCFRSSSCSEFIFLSHVGLHLFICGWVILSFSISTDTVLSFTLLTKKLRFLLFSSMSFIRLFLILTYLASLFCQCQQSIIHYYPQVFLDISRL